VGPSSDPLANLAKRMQYRSSLIEGYLAKSGLDSAPP
jgi:hypothetical protein